ncbi:PASTA domain-containing protein, partial [Streptomyces sp. SID4985]|uniref:Stk1 family PASTA domain-containing Ser/Thr kinase n=1 Tax=Streptomyces sp. SID4985 TaxID=2690292 RepID=UPI00136CEE6E
AEDRTSVIPRSLTVPRPLPVGEPDGGDVRYTARLGADALPPRRTATGPRRGVLALVAALVVLFVGAGVWYVNAGQFTKVPPLLSRTEAQAKKRIESAGLDVGKVRRSYSDTVQRGQVIGSEPSPGARIRDHGSVSLTISLGPQTVMVPDLSGRPLAEARAQLKSAGLEPGMVTREFSDEVERGSVISTTPGAGVERHAGSAIALVVSKGRQVDIPDVTGESLDDATQDLTDAGLKVKVAPERVHSSDYDKDQVVSQTPAEGTAAEGDAVTLTLSKGPEMIEVPDVTGQDVDSAKKTLEAAGFQVEEDRGLLGLFGDKVREQSVDGGDRAPKGSTITLTIR